MAGCPDEELVRRFRAGQHSAFAELVGRYERPLVNFLCRMVGDPSRAEELFQETFLRVFKHVARFDTSRQFKTWAYTIASNLAKNELRRRRVELPISSTLSSRCPNARDMLETSERQQAVKAAIGELPQDQQLVLTMRIYNGLTYSEIGEVLACSPGTAKSRMFYAIEKLRSRLEYLGPGGHGHDL